MRRLICTLALGALALVACEDDPRPTLPTFVDSESHWLEQCDADDQCGGLQCLCGVCTLPCDEAAACGALEDPVCQPVDACAPQGGICVPRSAAPDQGPQPDAAIPDMAAPDATIELDMAEPDAVIPDMAIPDAAVPDLAPPDASVPPDVEQYPCPVDGCCGHAECPEIDGRVGICRAADVDAQNTRCGAAQEANVCTAPQCDVDADCAGDKRCVGQAHGFRIKQCVPANCTEDADCVERPGGECTPFFTPCYNAGFACTYADDPCRTDEDCPQRQEPKICQPQEGGRTICADAVMMP